jgi:hypothetical protein
MRRFKNVSTNWVQVVHRRIITEWLIETDNYVAFTNLFPSSPIIMAMMNIRNRVRNDINIKTHKTHLS